MKALVLALTMLASSSAMAATVCDQSWAQIDRSGLQSDFPKIQFDSTFVSVDGVCEKGGMLYTAGKVEICDQWAQHDGGGCADSHLQTMSTNVPYNKDIPVNEFDFKSVPMRHSLIYQIPVGRQTEGGLQAVCMKTYTIRPCP